MPRALIVGGTGMIGRAVARRLLAAGWQVDLTGRNPDRLPADVVAAAGGRFVPADRDDPDAIPRRLAPRLARPDHRCRCRRATAWRPVTVTVGHGLRSPRSGP